MRKLDEAVAAEHSSTWIGVEEKTPSLIRLDKMCMYNELTGHGRPLKRRRVDRPDTQLPTTPDEPPVPVTLYSTLPPDMQMKATELAGLGFPLSHCSRALLETKGNVDAAANWIISNEQLLDTMDREEDKKQQQRQQWEQKQKEAADNDTAAASTSSAPSAAAVDQPILPSTVYPYAGQLGVVEEISQSKKQVGLRLVDADSAAVSSVWLPLAACEWDDTSIIHELPELNSRRFQGISGLALDVASSEFILYARRCVLLLLYTLSRAKGGKMELIRNLNANVFVRIVKLAAADAGPLTLPIFVPAWLSSSVSKQQTKGTSDEAALQVLSSLSNTSTTAISSPVSSSSLDIWHILHCILHNPVSIFASAVRDSLLHLLMDDVRQHLMTSSSTVRDVDTEHPYQSGVTERQEIRIESASQLLVTFDRRCNINQAHACLSLYADRDCTQELAVFSGSADEFSHLVVPGNHFFYQFISGSLRQKPYEFGFRFRVRPIGLVYKDETALLSHSLGWPVLVMMADSSQLLDTLLSFHGCSDLIQSLLRYLTVCRSPCKVLVTRALTALCVRIRQPMPSGMFEILLRVMEQLYESNTASGWGSSPFLMSLVDLIRVRPTFRLSESDLWSVESIDNRPAGWFFLTVLRAESLSKSLYHSSRLPHIRLVERAFHELSDMEVLRWCLKQPELCLTGDHRVLTRRGWRSITSVKEGDEVLTINTDMKRRGVHTWAQEWKPVTAVTSRDVRPGSGGSDTLYRMQGKGMDVIATRDHRMLLARIMHGTADSLGKYKHTEYATVGSLLHGLTYRAQSRSTVTKFKHTTQRHVICSGKNYQPAVKIDIPGLELVCDWWWAKDEQQDFLHFLGFWLGDGHLNIHHGTVCLSQKKEKAIQWLNELLDRLFPHWWRSSQWKKQPGKLLYVIHCPPLYNYLRRMGAGPLGYNPRDPAHLRSYPHFSYDAGLAAHEQQSAYHTLNNHAGITSTWTLQAMYDTMTGVTAQSPYKGKLQSSPAPPTRSSPCTPTRQSPNPTLTPTTPTSTKRRRAGSESDADIGQHLKQLTLPVARGQSRASSDSGINAGQDEAACQVCGSRTSTNTRDASMSMLLCDGWTVDGLMRCQHGCHLHCAGFTAVPKCKWYCWVCADERSSKSPKTAARTSPSRQTRTRAASVSAMVMSPVEEEWYVPETTQSSLIIVGPRRRVQLNSYIVHGSSDEDDAALDQEEGEEELDVETTHAGRLVTKDKAKAQAWRTAGKVVWYNSGWWVVVSGPWFYIKRWLGDEQQIANVYSQLSRRQAIALLDGFCRADGLWESIQYDSSGEPTGQWQCYHSSFPLIDQLQLIGQLTGAAVDLNLHIEAGRTTEIDGRTITCSTDLWRLAFSFNKSARGIPFQSAPLAEPLNVSKSIGERGYYKYEDDGRVYCITVRGNPNFLTQRLSNKRLQSGRIGAKAHSIFIGNCLKLHKQTRGWNSYRRDWMTGINGFTGYAQAAEVLVALKQSLLAECYRFVSWVSGTAGKEWEDRVKKATSAADIARCYMELEAALKWGDSYPETERAFGDTWASRRPDWLAAMKGLAAATQVKVITTQEVMEYRWTRAMDEQLVLYIDDMANKTARRLMSLTFRDIEPITKHDADNPTYSLLRTVPIECLRARFAILKMLSTDFMRVLPVVDLSLRASWSVSPLVRAVSKTLIFQQSKMYLWRSMLGRLYSEERPQFVILNRHEAAKKRKDARSRLLHSLFYQLFAHIGMLVDPSSLRRRGQAWMVKFVGEGGHDVGGLYNESLVDICNELQAEGNPNSTHAQLLPLFRLCPNGRHGVGDNRNKYVPNSASTSPLHLAMFEFVGRLMGICCLDNNRALPLDLSAHVWKSVTSESISGLDLKAIDYHAWNTINIIRHPQQHKLTQDTFEVSCTLCCVL